MHPPKLKQNYATAGLRRLNAIPPNHTAAVITMESIEAIPVTVK